MPTTVYSQPLPVKVVTSGGVPVIPVDANGQVIGDATRVVSTPMPVVETDANGAIGTTVYSMPLNVTVVSSGGMYVVGVNSSGVPTGTTLGATAVPVIQNGTFADTSNWTIVSGGGAASMSITPGSPGTLNSVSGSGNTAATCTQTLSGLVSGQSYTISGTCTARTNGSIAFSLGGSGGFSGVSVVGSFTVTVVAGSSNQDFVIYPATSLGGRTVSVTNLVLA